MSTLCPPKIIEGSVRGFRAPRARSYEESREAVWQRNRLNHSISGLWYTAGKPSNLSSLQVVDSMGQLSRDLLLTDHIASGDLVTT
jgi:hypothetical protein